MHFAQKICAAAVGLSAIGSPALATPNFWNLAASGYAQTWNNQNLITTNDDWSGVPSVMGYRGDNGAQALDTDPQTVLNDLSAIPNVYANLPIPDPFPFGGVGEFTTLPDPCIAMQATDANDSPNIVFYMNTLGLTNVLWHFQVRDVDGSPDDSIQQVAVQYRVGGVGNFVNMPGPYIPDASVGPNLTQYSQVFNLSRPQWDNQAMLELRVLTTNATGDDEWIGIDKIEIHGVPMPEPTGGILVLAGLALMRRR